MNQFKLDRNLFTPTQNDFLETARYLGYKKSNPPDAQISDLIKTCVQELFNVIMPQAVFDKFELKENGSNNNKIAFADTQLISKDLANNLRNCNEIYIFGATIGPQVDALIRKTQIFDSPKAAVFQAAGAMFVEKVVDFVNSEIKKDAAQQGFFCRPRYSPGYGDVSLNFQKEFFRLLPMSKIGLTLMDTLIMAPEKSVTAFVGSFKSEN